MRQNYLFSEKQRLNKWWIAPIVAVNAIVAVVIIWQGVLDGLLAPPFSWGLCIVFVLIPLILLSSIQLETQVREDGIYVKLFPFHFSFQFFPWENIRESFVRKYSPLNEYGGWGLRFGKNGTAYNMSGNQGLQLVLVNGKKILIGTNKPEELSAVLEKLGQLNFPS